MPDTDEYEVNNECELDFSLHYSQHTNEVFLKKIDKGQTIPPREYIFGEIPSDICVEELVEHFLINDIEWLPILQFPTIFKPVDENINIKNLFTLDQMNRVYSLERIKINECEILQSVLNKNKLIDKPFVLVDGVMLSNMMEKAVDNSALPVLAPSPGEKIGLTQSDFFQKLDSMSNKLMEKMCNNSNNNVDDYKDLENEHLLYIKNEDIFDISHITSHSQFFEDLISQQPDTDNITSKHIQETKNKIQSKRCMYVREVKFRDNIPQFDALYNNMAFKYPFELDSFQKEAILLLEQQQNVLVSAHTSAGKTVVAEYAIALSIKHGMKTIYTSPIKALSNQKYKDFKKSFDSVGIITGDIQLNPNASCVIMTTEILRAMLYQSSSTSLSDVEWVVFDEVHYINDEQRGVVWEELLIMLPREIKLVLLSATFPNCRDFASWIGSTRQQVIHVLITTKRPVPLEHYVYTATNRSNLNDCFSISDESCKFKKEGICQAMDTLRNHKTKSNVSVMTKFKNINQNKCEGLKCVMEYLRINDNIPVIFFLFSKDACMYFAKTACSYDYTSKSEKSQIISFFNSSINRLSSENLNLPQIIDMKLCLEKGIAVHHSGILPILREIVEILFQKSLVKVLFATETFSIGVNVPARTVVFLTLNKPCETGWRDLYPSEYIQMAGRAGRRGKDKSGTVIIVSSDPNELESIENIVNGPPIVVKSQFCLTYGLILRMLSKKSGSIVKIEDLMRSSFSEFGGQSQDDATNTYLDKIVALETEIANLENDLSNCKICCSHMKIFYEFFKELSLYQKNALTLLLCTPSTTKYVLKTGRICVVRISNNQYSIGVVSEEYENTKFLNNNTKGKLIPMMVLVGDCHIFKHQHIAKKISSAINHSITPYLTLNISVIENRARVYYLKVNYENIVMVAGDIVKVNWRKIMHDQSIISNRMTAHANSEVIASILKILCEIAQKINANFIFNTLKLLDISKFSNNFEDSYTINHYADLLTQLWSNNMNHLLSCIKCDNFLNHFEICYKQDTLLNDIEEIKFKLSDESLQLLPEYNSRLNVLRELGFIDKNKNLLLKGKLSNKFRNNYEIVLTELLLSMELIKLDPPYIAALLSCFVQQNKTVKKKSPPNFNPDLQKVWNIVTDMDEKISAVEQQNGIEFSKRYIYPDLIIPIYHWSNGCSFSEVVSRYKIAEGNLVRHILRLDEICSEMELASLYAGNPELCELIKKTRESIHKDIIFTPSLYLT